MAHFNDLWMPDNLAIGSGYGPGFVTEIVSTVGGKEKRNRIRPQPLRKGNLAMAPTLLDDYQELLALFMAVNGRFNTFRMRDWSDFECGFAQGGASQLTSTTVQLTKTYSSGSHTLVRDIQNPVAEGFALKYSGTPKTVDTDYTLDTATGIVTSLVGDIVAADITWAGEFDNAIRFDIDEMAPTAEAYQVMSWGGITIKEVRL